MLSIAGAVPPADLLEMIASRRTSGPELDLRGAQRHTNIEAMRSAATGHGRD